MRGKGRPIGSDIRNNIIEIIYFAGKAYGYEIYRAYVSIFPKATLRVIYYHLKKGVSTGEFVLKKIESEKGDYSWGDSAEKHYYSLGPAAKPKAEKRVKEYFDGLKVRAKT